VAVATRLVDAMNRVSSRFPALTLLWAPFAGVPEGDVDTLEVLEEFLAERDDPWYRALGHLGSGFQAWLVAGDAARAERHWRACLDGFRAVGDRWGMITSLGVLADLADHRGEPATATGLLGEALGLAEELDSAVDIAELLCSRASYALRAGDHAGAAAACERAVELSRRAGAADTLALAHLGLAETARLRGELAAAQALCEQALAECPAGWFSGAGIRTAVLIAMAKIAIAEGDADRARTGLAQAVAGDPAGLRFPRSGASACEAAAGLALLRADPRQAAALLGAAEALRGSPPAGPDADAAAAAARAALGDEPYDAARTAAASADRDTALAAVTAYLTSPAA
jgi:tetratricopeptide (TPR) repeat protein